MVTYPRAEADLAVWSESALRPPFFFCSLPPSEWEGGGAEKGGKRNGQHGLVCTHKVHESSVGLSRN